jgi:nucleoside-diphosphate-sugar epimerase
MESDYAWSEDEETFLDKVSSAESAAL